MNQEVSQLSGQLAAALTFIEQENYSEAVYAAERELAAVPGSPDAAHVLGLVAYRMDELLRAEELFNLSHKQAPNVREHAEALSIINAKLGRLHDALFYGKLSSVLVSDGVRGSLLPEWLGTFQEAVDSIDQTNFIEQGLQEYQRGDHTAAAESLRKGLQSEPSNLIGWRGLRDCLLQDRRPYEALLAAQSLASIDEPNAADLASAGEILLEIGRFTESQECFVSAIEQESMDLSLRSRYLKSLARADLESPDELFRQESLWSGVLPKIPGVAEESAPGKPLTIGVLSGTIKGGGLADIIWPLLDSSVADDITVNVYSNNTRDDSLTRRLRGKVDGWTDIGPTDDLTAGTIIKNDGVDILIDLDGHKQGGRPGLVARRPAPIVLRWCGVPVTDNAESDRPPYDGVIGDPTIYPEADARCILVDRGPFSLPPDASIAAPATIPKGVPLRVGLSVAKWQLSDQVFDFIEGICKSGAPVEFVLDFAALGGMSALDEIDPILEERGIYDTVVPSQPADTADAGLENFLNGVDVLLDPGPVPCPSLIWDCLSRTKPVFCVPGRQPESRLSASVMTGLGLGQLVEPSLSKMSTRLTDFAADTDKVNTLLKEVHQAVTNECGAGSGRLRAQAFLKALGQFRDKFTTIEA